MTACRNHRTIERVALAGTHPAAALRRSAAPSYDIAERALDPELEAEVAGLRAERVRARDAWWVLFVAALGAMALSGGRWWVWVPGAAVFGFAVQATTIITLGRTCPRCDAPLKVERIYRRYLPPRCPHCGLKIEEDGNP